MNPTKKSDDDSLAISKLIMKTPALKKSKYYINNGSFRHHNNCGSTHPSMPASMPPSFSGFKSQTFLHESCYESASYDGVSGTDNDEQLLNNSASVFHLWLLEAFSWFQNSSILPTQSSHNRGWIEKQLLLLIIVNRVIFNRLVTM